MVYEFLLTESKLSFNCILSYISTFLSLVVSIVTIPNEEYGVVLVSY